MTRATAQNGDLDFEQMMGELAAMKTDLAQRQASRSGSRPSTPRTGASDAEPRRVRTRRTPAETNAETSTSADTEASAVLPPSSPFVKASTALDGSGIDTKVEQVQEQAQPDAGSDPQATNVSETTGDRPIHAHTTIEAATLSSTLTSSSISSSSEATETIAQPTESQGTDTSASAAPVSPPSSGGSTLTRSESRRNTAVPLPQKSAQRSRSISHGSSRLSQTSHSDLNESIREAIGSEVATVIPEEVSTPTFGPTVPPRKFLRPYPSSPALSSTTGQMAPASPRLPARSNSRNYHKPAATSASAHAPSSTDLTPQGSPLVNQAPAIPPRARSGSKSLSRSNTFNRSEGGQDPGSPYTSTPTITEDGETALDSPQPTEAAISAGLQQQQQQQQQSLDQLQQLQSTFAASEDVSRNVVASDPPAVVSHMRKKSSTSILKPVSEAQDTHGHSLAPSLLPAESTPSPTVSAPSTPPPEQVEGDMHDSRPVIRKQKSVDPASMYRQHQQDLVRDRLPSRHASERRPNRDRNPSQQGSSPFMEVRENSHSREQSSDSQQNQERGRSHKKEESSSKGGIFAWVRSRSKSRDVSSSKPTYDTSHPVPEQTFEYNPALIPSRSGSTAGNQRAKSLPRKASNQNFHGTTDGWPPYSPGDMNGSSHQRNKSITRVGLNPPPFTGVSSAGIMGDTSAPQLPTLNASTNMSTVHHDNMIRGMGMGSTPISPAVLLTPQPSFPTTPGGSASGGGMRGVALAMMKNEGSPSSSEQQMQQRHLQLQQAQMQHIQQQQQQQQQMQQQQQRLAISTGQQQHQSSSETPASPRAQQNAVQGPMSPTAAAPVTQRLVATRIYIQTETDFKSVNLAANSTALDALHMLQQRGCFGEPGDGRYHDRWTIFEYSKEFMIERPLRDFEVILDVIKTWEADKDNKMICKSFPARDELSAQEVVRLVGPEGQANFVRPHGWVHLEIKKSKWVKRYLHITDTAVYHSKDQKFNGESMLCLLRNFDVYAVQVPRKKAPTKFGFALKSSDKIHLFETPEDDYIHYICTDSGDTLREWLAGLRAAKGMFMYHANPEMVREGQKHATELQASSGQDGKGKGNLTEEQVSMAEAKLAGWGMSLDRSRSAAGNRSR
ncbi:hypothetical protein BGZ75_002735 [Mortierella antarctica]|nr:hypothetical protein BGZ75_002735 [Mortierella antarctica]